MTGEWVELVRKCTCCPVPLGMFYRTPLISNLKNWSLTFKEFLMQACIPSSVWDSLSVSWFQYHPSPSKLLVFRWKFLESLQKHGSTKSRSIGLISHHTSPRWLLSLKLQVSDVIWRHSVSENYDSFLPYPVLALLPWTLRPFTILSINYLSKAL